MGEVMEWLANSVLSGAIGGGTVALVIWLWKTWISEKIKGQIKHEYDEKNAELKFEYDKQVEVLRAALNAQAAREIESLKNQFSLIAVERQIRFTRLHEKRAEAIADAYEQINEYMAALDAYTTKPETERVVKAQSTMEKFRDSYRKNRIYFPMATVKKLDDLSETLLVVLTSTWFGLEIDGVKSVDRDEALNRAEKQSKNAMSELDDDFRMLLGDETGQHKKQQPFRMLPDAAP